MELNIVSFFYLFFRLSPFIIVSYFGLSSVLNQDIKGVIYLVGLLVSCFITITVGNLIPEPDTSDEEEVDNSVCNLISIGHNRSFSKSPLGISMLSYTLFYLVYIIIKYKIVMYNIPTLVLLPLLILGDLFWNISNSCYDIFPILISIIIGGAMGALWARIIDSINQPNLFFFNVGSDKTVCQRPKKQLFKCTFKKR
tara:strand:- start:5276 stop:5866 length:591 start_codon:yes stop_codon:yes gene_type:complete